MVPMNISVEKMSIILVHYYLSNFKTKATIPDEVLNGFDEDMAVLREKGMKAIIRFSYTSSSDGNDAAWSYVKQHIAQYKSHWQANADVIFCFQAGIVGAWGEWYYTQHYGNQVTTMNAARRTVVDTLLAAVPADRCIQLRTPQFKTTYMRDQLPLTAEEAYTGTPRARLGHHNDAFLYDNEDMGTFHKPWQKDMWEQQSAYLITGGEAPYSSTAPSQMVGYTYNNVRSAIFSRHISYLHHDVGHHEHPGSTNPDHGSLLMRHWHEQGWMTDIKKWLGYRLWMENLKITGTNFSSGSTITVRLKIHNSGAAPVINERPMKLVLIHNGTPVVLKSNCGEIRSVASGTTETFTFNVTMPQSAVSGDKLALWLPDQADGLRDRPEYSIRLANSDVSWSNGYNILYTF